MQLLKDFTFDICELKPSVEYRNTVIEEVKKEYKALKQSVTNLKNVTTTLSRSPEKNYDNLNDGNRGKRNKEMNVGVGQSKSRPQVVKCIGSKRKVLTLKDSGFFKSCQYPA